VRLTAVVGGDEGRPFHGDTQHGLNRAVKTGSVVLLAKSAMSMVTGLCLLQRPCSVAVDPYAGNRKENSSSGDPLPGALVERTGGQAANWPAVTVDGSATRPDPSGSLSQPGIAGRYPLGDISLQCRSTAWVIAESTALGGIARSGFS